MFAETRSAERAGRRAMRTSESRRFPPEVVVEERMRFCKRAGIVLAVLAVSILALPSQAHGQSAAAWLDPAWNYRSAVTVTNNNGAVLTNFQIQLTLGGTFDFTKLNSGGSDLRVTASDGITLLPLWVQSWTPSSNQASVWTQVPSIPIAGTTIYIYYGNPAATSVSSGISTFNFFDDFEGQGSNKSGYWPLGPSTTILVQDQSWESAAPHTLSVVEANTGGHTYWGYYGLQDCGGVGLAWSEDLVTWTKDTANPLFTNGRWPNVMLIDGTYYMIYTKDYCATSYLMLATSTDGINFTDLKTLVQPQDGLRNQNPDFYFNPNDGNYYLYWYHGDDQTFYEIHARNALSPTALDDPTTEVTILTSPTTLAAPNMFYYQGTYFLSTEILNNSGTTAWNVLVYGSTTSPTSGFELLADNPIMSDNSACMFQTPFGTTLHEYYCNLNNGTWTLQHRAADLTQPRVPVGGIDPTRWTASGGNWTIVQDVQQDGTTGGVLQAMTSDVQLLMSSFSGGDYVLDVYGKQLSGRVWGIASRVEDQNDFYSANLYDDLGNTNNLYLYKWTSSANQAVLGSVALGPVNPNTWYKMSLKSHSSEIDVYKDDVLQIKGFDTTLRTGGVALYGESGGVAEFNNVIVRQYAALDPTSTVGPATIHAAFLLALSPSSVFGGSNSTGTITLAGPAPSGGAVVTLASNNGVATVPANVTVAAGATTGTFTISTSGVATTTVVTITATYSGTNQTATLTVTPLLSSVALSPSSVLGGSSSTGTVTLAGPAPSGGAVVTLASNNAVATVPANVTVAAGATTGTFTISTSGVATTTVVTITATYSGTNQTATLTVTPLLSSVALSPSSVFGGSSPQGTITLAGPAPAGGAVVTLASNNAAATVPANVTVAAGATTGTFTISTSGVAITTVVTITATYSGVNQTATLTVTPLLSSVALSPSSVFGGSSSTGTITLAGPAPSGGAVVTLASNNAVATVPANVTVAAGATTGTFTISTSGVATTTAVTITASYSGVNQTATLTVTPLLSSVALSPSSVFGGSNSTGTITLAAPAPSGGAVVTLASNNAVATVPASVTVAAGATTGTFTISTSGVVTTTVATITATYSGVNQTATLTVTPLLSSVALSPSSVFGGSSSTGTITLAGPAPAGGAVVTLASNNAAATVPASVTVAAGATSGTFAVSTSGVATTTVATITATYSGVNQTAALTVTPLLSSVALSPSSVFGGSSPQGTITLAGPAPAGGAVVTLASNNTAVATVPASITVAAGASSGTFTVSTVSVTATTAVTISAIYGAGNQSAILTVQSGGGGTGAGWMDPAWQYRNAITIANPGGTALSNYQVNVVLGSTFGFASAQASGADVRMTASDGVTQIPFWIESWSASTTTASVWVNVPTIPSGGTVVYLYYGNAAATSVSSGTNTFNFFDDFSGGSISASNWTASGGTWTVVNDTQQDGTTGAVARGSTTARQVLSSTYTGTNYTVDMYGKQISGRLWGLGVRATGQTNLDSVNLYDDLGTTNNLYVYSWVNNSTAAATGTLGTAAVGTVSANTWYKLSVKVHGTELDVFKDGVQKITATNSSLPSGGIALYGENGTVAEFNNVRVRQYAATEPVATVNGATTQAQLSVTLNPTSVTGGSSSTGTITLAGPAPAGGAVVTLASNNAAATVPANVTVAAGATTGTFTVSTTGVGASTAVTITASYNASNQTATLTVTPLLPSSLALSPSSVVGGSSSSGTITLAGPAPSGGAVVTLASNNAVATVPANVTVAAGATTGTFTISTSGVATTTAVTITASYSGTNQTATLTVTPLLSSVALSPSSVFGGSSSTGTITLAGPAPSGGAVVTLASNNAVATVPANVTVAAGATTGTFTISTSGVTTTTVVTITASYSGTNQTATLTVTPLLSSVALSPSSVFGGSSSTGTITLAGPAPSGGAVVTLASNNAVATVPANVTVAAGATTGTFTISTSGVATTTAVTITASYSGTNQTATLTVTPLLSSVALSPSSVFGGSSSTGTITLAGPAPAGGAVVTLASNNAAATVPANVTVAAGATTGTFTISTSGVATTTVVTITATYSGTNQTATLTVTPLLSSVALSPSSVLGGSSSTGTITLAGPAPSGGAVVTLASNNAVATVPANVTVAAGATTGTFTISTSGVAITTVVTITATYSGVNQTATLTVTPLLPSSLALSPSSVLGGSSSTGTITLAGPAPSGGAVITLASNNAVAMVPANVTVAAGATTGTFTISTSGVATTTAVTITASYSGTNQTATLTVTPLLSSVALSPSSVFGGSNSTGTITLAGPAPAGGAVVTLASNNAAATVPASVTVAAGATTGTFTISTSGVATTTVATITATYSGTNQTATLTVTPLLSSVALSPSSVFGGSSPQGTITLAGPAPAGGAVVTLASNNAAATVPASVTVAAGATSGTFAVSTSGVATTTVATITATYSGVNQTAALTVTPLLSSVALSPSSVFGGSSPQGTITLAGPAPAGGAVVTLASNNTAVATVPASITVAAGASSGTFTVSTVSVTATTAVTISAIYGAGNQSAILTVQSGGGGTGAGWMVPAWQYRNAITIANPGGTALSNYQVNVVLGSTFGFASAQASGADVRMTASDGVTQIPFWIESWSASTTTASVWVNVPTIPSGGTVVYLYYGNAAATSVSSGTNTFNFFDDFSGGSISASNWTASGGTWTVVNDTQQDGTTGAVARGSTTARQVLSSTYTGTNYTVDMYGKQISGRLWGLGVRATGQTNLDSVNLYDDLGTTNNLYVYSWVNNSTAAATGTLGTAAVGTVSANTWYKLSVKVHGTELDVFKDGVQKITATNSSLPSGGIALYGENGTVAEFNNVRVRQYAATEPVATVNGATTQAQLSVTLNPTSVTGGSSSTGTITLAGPAPAGGAVVTLASNNAAATVPANVTVAAGATTGTFTVSTTGVGALTAVTITASYNASNQTATLTVTP